MHILWLICFVMCKAKDLSYLILLLNLLLDDTLLAINGVEVSERNINYVLAKIRWPAEVQILFRSVIYLGL